MNHINISHSTKCALATSISRWNLGFIVDVILKASITSSVQGFCPIDVLCYSYLESLVLLINEENIPPTLTTICVIMQIVVRVGLKKGEGFVVFRRDWCLFEEI